MHINNIIFMKVGGKTKGERKIKLLKHTFALNSLPLTFSKKFSRSLRSLDCTLSSN